MSINVNVGGNTDPLVRDVDAAVKRINRSGGIKIRVDDKGVTQPLGNMKRSADEFTKSLEASNARVLAFGASVGIINAVSNAFKGLVEQTIKVEKNLTDINVVMNLSSKQLDSFGSGLFKVASETGAGFQVASEAATEFARQGLSVVETLKRTKDALVLTRLTGMKSTEAVKSLTAAMNTFKGEVKDSTQLVSKFAAVDVKFAVSAQDFADAISRAGASARSAGVDINELIGLVTAAQERTARGGAVIGNSFKTIFTRVRRSSTLEELDKLGVSVRDVAGKTLPAMKILQGLADKYDTLTDAQRSYISQNVAGVFQINILKAAMADLGQANSVTAQATQIAAGATDESNRKNEQLRETMSALAGETSVSIQKLAKSIGDISLAPGINKILDGVKGVADWATGVLGDGDKEGDKFAKGILAGVGNFLSGPGLVILTAVVAKLFTSAIKYGASSLASLLNINKAAGQRKSIEQNLLMVLAQNAALSQEMLRTDISRAEKEKIILSIIKQQTIEAQKLSNITKTITPSLIRSGVNQNLSVGGGRRGGSSGGYIPNYAAAEEERKGAQQGGYAPGAIKTMNVPGQGPMIYNSAEKVKEFKGFSQPAIMPPMPSKAAKDYREKFAGAHGFDPYASVGFIPNFSRQGNPLGSFSSQDTQSNSYRSMFGDGLNSVDLASNKKVLDDWLGTEGNRKEWDQQKTPGGKLRLFKNRNSPLLKTNLVGSAKRKHDTAINLNQVYPSQTSQMGVVTGAGHKETKAVDYVDQFNLLSKKDQQKLSTKINQGKKKAQTIEGKTKIRATLPTKGLTPVTQQDEDSWSSALGESIIYKKFEESVGRSFDRYSSSIGGAILGPNATAVSGSVQDLVKNPVAMGHIFESALRGGLAPDNTRAGVDRKARFDFEGAPAKQLAKWMKDETLSKIELKLHQGTADVGKIPGKVIGSAARGYVPNFADALTDAVGREKEAGVPVSKIRVGTHKSLVAKSNPVGLGVTNTDDEPNGLKDVLGSGGFVPNYVFGKINEKIGGSTIGKAMGSQAGIEEANAAASEAGKKYEELTTKLEKAKSVEQDTIDERKGYKKALGQQQQTISKQKKAQEAELKLVNDSTKTRKQRRAAQKRHDKGQTKLAKAGDDLLTARKKLAASERKLKSVQDQVSSKTTEKSQAKKDQDKSNKTAQRRERVSANRGMAGMGAMMGASMLSGQLQQSSNPNMQVAAGALSGAATGASMGMMFGPWGTAIGAAVGALGGFINATDEAAKAARNKAREETAQMDKKFLQEAQSVFSQLSSAGAVTRVSAQKVGGVLNKDSEVDVRKLDLGSVLSGAIKRDKVGEEDEKKRDEAAKLVRAQASIDSKVVRYTDGNFGEDNDKAEDAYNSLAQVPAVESFLKGFKDQFEDGNLGKAMKALNIDLDNVAGSFEQGYARDYVPTAEFNDVTDADNSNLTNSLMNNPKYEERTVKAGSSPELSVLSLATQSLNDNLITQRGVMTRKQFDNDKTLTPDQKNAAIVQTKIIKEEIQQILQSQTNLNKFEDVHFKTVKENVSKLSTTINKADSEIANMNFGQVFSELSIAESSTKNSKDENKRAKLDDIGKQRQQLVGLSIEALDDSFQDQMIHNGKVIDVNKQSLLAMEKEARNLGEGSKFYNQFALMMSSKNLELDKQTVMLRKQLSSQQTALMFQNRSAEAQQEIINAQLELARSYSMSAAKLGKQGFSDEFAIQSKYNLGMSNAGSRKKQADTSARDTLSHTYSSMALNAEGEDWSTIGKLLKAKFEPDDDRYEREIFDILAKKQETPQGRKELELIIQGKPADTNGEGGQQGLTATDANLVKKVQIAQQLEKNQLAKSQRDYDNTTHKLETNKLTDTASKERLSKLQQTLNVQKNLNQSVQEEIAGRLRLNEIADMNTVLSRGLGIVSHRTETDRKQFDSNVTYGRRQKALQDSTDDDRNKIINKFSQDQGMVLDEKTIKSMHEDPTSLRKKYANNKITELEANMPDNPNNDKEIEKIIVNQKQEMAKMILLRRGELDLTSEHVVLLVQVEAELKRISERHDQHSIDLEKQRGLQEDILKLDQERFRGENAFSNGFNDAAGEALRNTETFRYELAKSIPETFSSNMSAAMMKLVREGGSFGDAMRDAFTGMLDTINQKFMDQWMDQAFGALYQEPVKPQAQQVASPAVNPLAGVDYGVATDPALSDFFQNSPAPANLGTAATTEAASITAAGQVLASSITTATPQVQTAITGLATTINAASTAISVTPTTKISGDYSGGAIKRNAGGTVPAMLTNGEYVINRRVAKALGTSRLDTLNTGAIPGNMESDPIKRSKGGGTDGAMGAGLLMGIGSAVWQKNNREDPEDAHVSRPDDYFQKNPLWKKRNMSRSFLMNDKRAQEDVRKGRAEKQKELQKWIADKNADQAFGRQMVTLVGNLALSKAAGGLNMGSGGAEGGESFLGLDDTTTLGDKWGSGNYSGRRIKRNSGGPVSGSPGIDRVPAMLTEGEYVINARAVRQIGMGNLEKINRGKFNQGGAVGETTSPDLSNQNSKGAGTNNINITVNVSSDNSSKESVNTSAENTDQSSKKEGADKLSKKIKQEVITIIKEENRPGGLLR